MRQQSKPRYKGKKRRPKAWRKKRRDMVAETVRERRACEG